MLNVQLLVIEMNMDLLSEEYASFKCGDLAGVIHSPSENGPYTAILDGGYLLGKFKDEFNITKTITFLASQIESARVGCGMDYPAYKRAFADGVASVAH